MDHESGRRRPAAEVSARAPDAEQARDLEVVGAILAVVVRHGGGPYSVEDLAALAGQDVDDTIRVMEHLADAGLAIRDEPSA